MVRRSWLSQVQGRTVIWLFLPCSVLQHCQACLHRARVDKDILIIDRSWTPQTNIKSGSWKEVINHILNRAVFVFPSECKMLFNCSLSTQKGVQDSSRQWSSIWICHRKMGCHKGWIFVVLHWAQRGFWGEYLCCNPLMLMIMRPREFLLLLILFCLLQSWPPTFLQRLFKYIGGANDDDQKIAMTAPVVTRVTPGDG